MSVNFSDRVLNWFDQHGRHDLPWKQTRSLYHIWLSEIMLQQTQVSTVIPYYQRFINTFPDLNSLISASLDDVLVLWAGLGYYTRARNLYKAAQMIAEKHGGCFPDAFDDVLALPGVGRSTAGAILAQALNQRHVILDGNVRRVLCRYFAIEGWPGKKTIENRLWQKAEDCTPAIKVADYTQAMMDLGATVCTRARPRCMSCPVQEDCRARIEGRVEAYPTPRPRKTLPVKTTRMLMLTDNRGAIFLEKRPPTGIWGGLWSLPEASTEADVGQVCQQRWGIEMASIQEAPIMRHTFSHYHLDIHPCRVNINERWHAVQEPGEHTWCDSEALSRLAVARPVASLLLEHLNIASQEA